MSIYLYEKIDHIIVTFIQKKMSFELEEETRRNVRRTFIKYKIFSLGIFLYKQDDMNFFTFIFS